VKADPSRCLIVSRLQVAKRSQTVEFPKPLILLARPRRFELLTPRFVV
jgi:hypothetical protein